MPSALLKINSLQESLTFEKVLFNIYKSSFFFFVRIFWLYFLSGETVPLKANIPYIM